MPIQSGGAIVKSAPTTTLWTGRTDSWPEWLAINGGWQSYSQIYRKQLWVNTLVSKRANATARLPWKTYEHTGPDSREDASDSPFGRLMARPSNLLHSFLFWNWVSSTFDIHGEAFLGKVRDRGGRPIELVPLHPQFIRDKTEGGVTTWSYVSEKVVIDSIDRRDLVHFRTFNPDSILRGLSKLEPLRETLANEDGARRANGAMWKHGGRPSMTLETPATLSDPAYDRLNVQWKDIHSGVDNWAKALILEEGMTANMLSLNVEELQYIEGRKLNREECCAAYDMPPAAVQLMDRATFSNITENLRSVYRDTMAPHLGGFESTIEFELRDGRFERVNDDPDFGDAYYGEFLLDQVLRGDFEARQDAYVKADYMTMAEKRARENLPFIPGTDRIFVNSASLPLQSDGTLAPPVKETLALPPGTDPSHPDQATATPPDPIPAKAMRSLMGWMARATTPADVDWAGALQVVESWPTKNLLMEMSVEFADEPIEAFRSRIRRLAEGNNP